MKTRFMMFLLDNNRSKAYLQNFLRFGYPPTCALVLDKNPPKKPSAHAAKKSIPGFNAWFNENESVYSTLETNGIPYVVIPTMDANAMEVVQHVQDADADVVIYSGPGGVILKEPILDAGKPFLHAHPGLVPHYKGSTTIYYSMLLQQNISCSVFFMQRALDAGDILFAKTFPVPHGAVNYDTVVDPLVRAETLIAFIQSVEGDISMAMPLEQTEKGNTFYVIHPLLKHLAISKNNIS